MARASVRHEWLGLVSGMSELGLVSGMSGLGLVSGMSG